jgi:hypothetical protein
MKDRTDKTLPRLTPVIESCPPILPLLAIEAPDPHLMKDRRLIDEPADEFRRVERFDPILTNARTESELPEAVWSMIDKLFIDPAIMRPRTEAELPNRMQLLTEMLLPPL